MNLGVHVFFQISVLGFVCFLIYIQEWNCWIILQLYFQLFGKPLHCFPQWLHKFTFPLKVYEGSSLVVQWLEFGAFTAEAPVQSLVWDLSTSRPLHSMAKKKERKKEEKIPFPPHSRRRHRFNCPPHLQPQLIGTRLCEPLTLTHLCH